MTGKFKKEQIKILSRILDIDESALFLLSERGIIDYPSTRTILIKNEYDQMLQEGISNKNIVTSFMSKYKLSKSSVEKAIYKKS